LHTVDKPPSAVVRVVASWTGNTIEFDDFLIYGLASALVFGKQAFGRKRVPRQ